MGAIPGMATLATAIMKKKMDKAHIPNLPELTEMAQIEGVGFVACKLTVDMMEIKEEQLMPGTVIWTAEEFMKYAKTCSISLFT